MSIFDNLISPAAVGNAVMGGFEKGQKQGQEMQARRALAVYAADPAAPGALSGLIATSPELGFKAMEVQRQAQADQREARAQGALGRYVSQTYGLAPRRGVLSAPPVQESGASPSSLPSMSADQPPAGKPATPTDTPGATQGPDAETIITVLGKPQDAADDAFFEALMADPKAAIQIDSLMRDNFVKRIKAEHDIYDFAVSRLAGVTDEDSYQAVVAEVDQRLAPLGESLGDRVPSAFPGAEGIADLRMRALGVKDQMAALLRSADVAADNARADRNTNSIISDRQARTGISRERLGETRANNRRRDVTTRRGQDKRSSYNRPISVKTIEQARALKPGTQFRGPDGIVRTR